MGKRHIGKIKGFVIQFLPYSEIRDLDSDRRIRKILEIVLDNNILIIQGRLKADEEARLIGDTMAMIGHMKHFRGIELAVISGNKNIGIFASVRKGLAATIVKEIKRNPKKIELMLKR
jgi:hypothetical protein